MVLYLLQDGIPLLRNFKEQASDGDAFFFVVVAGVLILVGAVQIGEY